MLYHALEDNVITSVLMQPCVSAEHLAGSMCSEREHNHMNSMNTYTQNSEEPSSQKVFKFQGIKKIQMTQIKSCNPVIIKSSFPLTF